MSVFADFEGHEKQAKTPELEPHVIRVNGIHSLHIYEFCYGGVVYLRILDSRIRGSTVVPKVKVAGTVSSHSTCKEEKEEVSF